VVVGTAVTVVEKVAEVEVEVAAMEEALVLWVGRQCRRRRLS